MDRVDVMKVVGEDGLTGKPKPFVRQLSVSAGLSQPNMKELQEQFTKDKEQGEKLFSDTSALFAALNEQVRAEAQRRIEHLLSEATADAKQLGELWTPREQYREHVAAQNESLEALLGRAISAKEAAQKVEAKAAEEAAKLAEKLRKEEEKKAKKK